MRLPCSTIPADIPDDPVNSGVFFARIVLSRGCGNIRKTRLVMTSRR
jgi:hypothetical protein